MNINREYILLAFPALVRTGTCQAAENKQYGVHALTVQDSLAAKGKRSSREEECDDYSDA